jgi:Recombination directionality factor-like
MAVAAMSTSLTTRQALGIAPLVYDHPDLSLMLSVGEVKKGQRNPTRLHYFRAKAGRDDRWLGAATAFDQRYAVTRDEKGDTTSGPKVLPIHFSSDRLEDILDIRYLAFGQDRLAARGDTNYATCPQRYIEPEWITTFPLEGEPSRFQIGGPTDPLCLGGDYGIPPIMEKGKPSGKPALAIVSTLYFSLAEVGSFTATCAISTKSVKSRSRLLRALKMIEATGSMTHWLMLLTVKPTQIRYRDDAGKSHTSTAPILDLVGPIHSLEDKTAITISEAHAEIDKIIYARGLQAGAPSVEAPRGLPAPDGAWVTSLIESDEPVEGEIVNGDGAGEDDGDD